MNREPKKPTPNGATSFGSLGDKESLEEQSRHPDRTDDCLPLDRVFVAIGLEPEEDEHLTGCGFCKRTVEAFRKIPMAMRRIGRVAAAPVGTGLEGASYRRLRVGAFVRNHPWVSAAAMLLCVALASGAGVATIKVKALLEEAAGLRSRLDAIHKAAGLDQAVNVEFGAEQPNVAKLAVRINPALVRYVAVTYDKGETWRRLYDGRDAARRGDLKPGSFLREDKKAFAAPVADERTVTARVRVQYIPEVVAAFPEYKRPENTDRIGVYQLTPAAISVLAGPDITTAKPVRTMGVLPLDASGWEIGNSSGATASLDNDRADGALLLKFKLGKVGEWANISHFIVGATATRPAVSLEKLHTIEISLHWAGKQAVAFEPKLVDDHGRIVGITKIIEPGRKARTILIPARLLKGYFGVRNFDFSRVRRLDLAVARKASDHAAEGTIKIHGIKLLGTTVLPPPPPIPPPVLLAKLSLAPELWETGQSDQAEIDLSAKDGVLVCKVSLPYDPKRDRELPYTDLRTNPPERDVSHLRALEFEVMWEGAAPVTIEPKLATSEEEDTYGTQRRLRPSAKFQRIRIRPHELRYYWSKAGAPTDATRMNLSDLRKVGIGIARKALDQADKGTLYVKAVRLLGRGKKSSPDRSPSSGRSGGGA